MLRRRRTLWRVSKMASKAHVLQRQPRRQTPEEEEREDEALARAAEEAYNDPDNQELIPWEQVKAESRARP